MVQELVEKALVPFIRMLMRLFFREIEVINTENVPLDRPVIYTPNHPNSMVDGMLGKPFLPRDPRLLAKAALWNNPVARPLVAGTNCIPVRRRQDVKDSSQPVDNTEMFTACARALAENSAILLFPEGTSHDEPGLLPLKSGAARIALTAERDHGPLGLRIVPVGLNFDDKDRIRSRVLICVGEPIDPLTGVSAADPEDRELVDKLTGRIAAGLKAVTLNYPSWEEARVIRRAAELYHSTQVAAAGKQQGIVDEFSLQKQMADGYPAMKEKYPRKVNRVVRAVNSYDRLMRVLGIQHEHFMQDRPGIIHTISNLRKMSLFLVRLPLVMAGIFLNAIPYLLTRSIGAWNKLPENRASTAMIFAALFIYPLLWTLEARILGHGLLPAWFWWLLAPVSGVISVHFLEHYAQTLEEMTTYFRLETRSEIREEVEERLETVEREVRDYVMAVEKMASYRPPDVEEGSSQTR